MLRKAKVHTGEDGTLTSSRLGLDAPFQVTPLGEFGAEIVGADLAQPLNENVARHLRGALAAFQLLVLRKQHLLPAQQVKLASCFGDLEGGVARRPEGHRLPGHPDILYLTNECASPTAKYGMSWHSDGLAYATVPHGATLLYCLACPPGVGDTLFANQYRAYAAMSDGLRSLLSGLFWHLPKIPYSEIPPGKGLVHPIVRQHPQTKRHFVFCAPNACQLRGLTRRESTGLLDVIHEYQLRDEGVYRHSWAPRDLVVWENCALLHNRADAVDFRTQGLRAMHRSATSGNLEAIECEAAED
jgi:taurine dioxygenase